MFEPSLFSEKNRTGQHKSFFPNYLKSHSKSFLSNRICPQCYLFSLLYSSGALIAVVKKKSSPFFLPRLTTIYNIEIGGEDKDEDGKTSFGFNRQIFFSRCKDCCMIIVFCLGFLFLIFFVVFFAWLELWFWMVIMIILDTVLCCCFIYFICTTPKEEVIELVC